MCIPQKAYLESIHSELTTIGKEIKHQYNNGDTGIAWMAERYIQELLNVVFDGEYCLINLNYEKPNYPAVDLGDANKGIAWQVTVTNNKQGVRSKIKHTLTAFFNNQEKEQYETLKHFKKLHLFIATGMPDQLSPKDIPESIETEQEQQNIETDFFNVDHIWDFNRLDKRISQITNTVVLKRIEEIVKKVKNRPVQNKYSFELDYIPRTVTIGDSSTNQLTEETFNTQRRHVVLLGNGGEGKTIFADHLAHRLAGKEGIFCIKVRLIRYSQNLQELIYSECPNWENYYPKLQPIFIFDGLDEVDDNRFIEVFKEIELFVKAHRRVYVITTCRTNFYPLDIKERKDENFLAVPCFLEEMHEEDRHRFIGEQLGEKADEFLSALNESKLKSLSVTPFFLTELLNLYRDQQVMPESKVSFLYQVMKRRFALELSKTGSIKQSVKDNEVEILKGLKRIAFLMQYAGVHKITEQQLQEVILNSGLRQMIKRLMLVPLTDDCSEWRFRHNNFQEYFAAKCLLDLEWEKMQQVLFIPENKKLRPKWLNTISFFIGMEEWEEEEYLPLLNWLARHDKDALVKFEADKLSLEKRTEVFKAIFNEHVKDGLRIRNNGFTLQELARFADVDRNWEVVSFLLEFIKQEENDDGLKLDAVEIINQRREPGSINEEILSTYLLVYKANEGTSIQLRIIDGLHNWKKYEARLVEIIIRNTGDLKEFADLTTLFLYIAESGYSNISAIFLFDCLDAILKESNAPHYYYYTRLLALINSTEQLEIYLKMVLEIEENCNDLWHDEVWDGIAKKVNNKAIDLFKDDERFFSTYIRFVNFIGSKVNYYRSNNELILKLKPYLFTYQNTTRFFVESLIEAEKCEKWDERHFYIPVMLFTDDKADVFIDLISKGSISKMGVMEFLDSLKEMNKELFDRFYGQLNQRFSNEYLFKMNPREEQRRVKEKLLFESLLNKELFLSHVKTAFTHLGDIIKYEEIDKRTFREKRPIEAALEIGLDFLRGIIPRNGTMTKKKILGWISVEANWDWYRVVIYNKQLVHCNLPEANLKWIKRWCGEVESTIDFKNFDFLSRYIRLMVFTQTPPKREICIRLVYFIGYFYGYSFGNNISLEQILIEKLGISGVKKEIIRLFRKGISDSLALQGILNFIDIHEIKEVKSDMVPYIINPDVEYFFRNKLIRVYNAFGGGYVLELDGFLDLIDDKGQIEWDVIKILSDYNNQLVCDWMKQNKERLNIDPYRMATILLKQKPKEAMEFYLDELKRCNAPLSDRFQEKGSFFDELKVSSTESLELLDFCLEVLTIMVQMKFLNNEKSDTLPKVFTKLYELFKETRDFSLVEKTDERVKHIQATGYQQDTISNILYWHKDFKRKCLLVMDKEVRFRKALKCVRQLVPELYNS
ncbi:hypothetical protein DMA11_18560 [Marinilabiliaceae bacterium JC017]|nr:hypothetical protein DMA11_18560 [Marinilabiliaceae bacterium JC017]